MIRNIKFLFLFFIAASAMAEYSGPKTVGVELLNEGARVTYYGEFEKQSIYVEVFDKDKNKINYAWLNESSRSFYFKGYGIFTVKFLEKIAVVDRLDPSKEYSDLLIWVQDIYVPSPISDQISKLAENYKPVLIFNKDEEYFPMTLDEILDYKGADGKGEIKIVTTFLKSYIAKPGDDLKGFMQYNGHKDFWFDFGNAESTKSSSDGGDLYLRELKEAKSKIPTIYWDAQENGNDLYLMYYMFYAFDPKDGTSSNPGIAAHAFDREGFLIHFVKDGVDYQPVSITYGAHLSNQKMNLMGCFDTSIACLPREDDEKSFALEGKKPLYEWTSGRTTLSWESALKIGLSPVLYLAQGSHAVFPTYGFYRVGLWYVNKNAELLEEAGSLNSAKYLLPNKYSLNKLNYDESKFLNFSGDWVDILTFGGAKFPPFIRNPYEKWHLSGDFNFINCLDKVFDDSENCQILRDDYFKYIRGLDNYNALNIKIDLGNMVEIEAGSYEFRFETTDGYQIQSVSVSNESGLYSTIYDASAVPGITAFKVFARSEDSEQWLECGLVSKYTNLGYMYADDTVDLTCDVSESIDAPVDLMATDISDQSATLGWYAVDNAQTYSLYFATESFAGITDPANLTANGADYVAGITGTSYQLTGLTNDTTYYLVVTATDASGKESAPSNEVSATPKESTQATPTGTLNDTAITWGGNYSSGNYNTCTSNIDAPQDCNQGRDALAAAGTLSKVGGGNAGFDFTKLDANGNDLPESASSWSCVRDNVTGLIWEVKDPSNGTVGDSLHDADDRYNWYNTDSTTNGGSDGYADDDGAICYGYNSADSSTFCNTQAYTARVNTQGLCGANDWRHPKKEELRSIVHYGRTSPSVDTDYFPNTRNNWYWSGSPRANRSNNSWFVDFNNGNDGSDYRNNAYHVRLVRSAP